MGRNIYFCLTIDTFCFSLRPRFPKFWTFKLLKNFYFFFNFVFLNWSIIVLQCCVGFCCTTMWISYTHTHTHTCVYICMYACIPSLLNLPHYPPHLTCISSSRKWVAFGKRFYLVLPPGNRLRESSSARLLTLCQWGCRSVLRAGCTTHGPSLIGQSTGSQY